MAATHHPAHRVQRLLWAIGEAHRQRRAGDSIARAPGGAPTVDDASVPASATAGVGPGMNGVATSPALSLSVSVLGGHAILGLAGHLNGLTAADFLERVLGLVAEGARSIIVDLGGTEVVDPQGLAALDDARILLASASGELVLRSPRSATLELLSRTGTGDRFVIR